MVILQIYIGRPFGRPAKGDPPVAANPYRKLAFAATRQGMEPKSRQINVLGARRQIDRIKNKANTRKPVRTDAGHITLVPQLLERLILDALDHAENVNNCMSNVNRHLTLQQ